MRKFETEKWARFSRTPLMCSSAMLVVVAVSCYQHLMTAETNTNAHVNKTVYREYEEVRQLLERRCPTEALQLLDTLPPKIPMSRKLLRDREAEYSPIVMVLEMGRMLRKQSREAVNNGDWDKLTLLRTTQKMLSQRLRYSNDPEETQNDQMLRLKLATLLDENAAQSSAMNSEGSYSS